MIFPLFCTVHCALKAVIGSSLDAFNAGNTPAAMLRLTEIIHTLNISLARKIGGLYSPLPGRMPALRA